MDVVPAFLRARYRPDLDEALRHERLQSPTQSPLGRAEIDDVQVPRVVLAEGNWIVDRIRCSQGIEFTRTLDQGCEVCSIKCRLDRIPVELERPELPSYMVAEDVSTNVA